MVEDARKMSIRLVDLLCSRTAQRATSTDRAVIRNVGSVGVGRLTGRYHC